MLAKFKMCSSDPSGEVRCESGFRGRGQAEINSGIRLVHAIQDGLRSQRERKIRGTKPGSVYIKCSEDEEERRPRTMAREVWSEPREEYLGKPNKGSSSKGSDGPSVSNPAERSSKMSSEK